MPKFKFLVKRDSGKAEFVIEAPNEATALLMVDMRREHDADPDFDILDYGAINDDDIKRARLATQYGMTTHQPE